MKSFKDPESGLWLPKRQSLIIPRRVVQLNSGGMGIGLRRDTSGGGGGGSPAIVQKATGTLDAVGNGYSSTRSFTIPATGTSGVGVAVMTELSAAPGITCTAGGNTVTAQGNLGGLNVYTVILSSSVTSLTFSGGVQWTDWYAAWIEFSVVTNAESWGTSQTFYSNSHTTSAGTPTHANAVIVSCVNAGYTGGPGTTGLSSGAPWSLENNIGTGSSLEILMGVHLTPSNGTPYTSSWTQTGGQSWNSVTGVLY